MQSPRPTTLYLFVLCSSNLSELQQDPCVAGWMGESALLGRFLTTLVFSSRGYYFIHGCGLNGVITSGYHVPLRTNMFSL